METFDPSAPLSSDFGIFGMPIKRHDSRLIMIPVPWEVTTSYGSGTAHGPEAIREASSQLDLYDIEMGKVYIPGFYMEPVNQKILSLNSELKPLAQRVKDELEGGTLSEKGATYQHKVNAGCKEMVEWVYQGARRILKDEGKLLGLVGGDHSSPLGAIQAVAEHCRGEYAIIHFDAHADLRRAYMGFTYSHASIMYNVMTSDFAPKKLVQIGIRDFCLEEFEFSQNDAKIRTIYDDDIKKRQYAGESWQSICEDILFGLPQNIYISFDIDGLSPHYCPSTGTPVPGGLSFTEATHLLSVLGHSGRKIVGFDLNEVAPSSDGDQWDGNVGARLLYKLCGWSVVTNEYHQLPGGRG